MPVVKCPACQHPLFAKLPVTVCEKCGESFRPSRPAGGGDSRDASARPWHRTARQLYWLLAVAVPIGAAIWLHLYLRTALEPAEDSLPYAVIYPLLALVVLGAIGGAAASWGLEFSPAAKRRRALGLKKIWFGLPTSLLGIAGFGVIVAYQVANYEELGGVAKIVARLLQLAFGLVGFGGVLITFCGLSELVSGRSLGFRFDVTALSFLDKHRDDEDDE